MTLPRDRLDTDAVGILAELQHQGYVAYLVGGCVRDMLMGETPKDFDIGTTARPEEIRAVFGRRCRLIGRRFKLAHVRSGGKIFEVATFRGPPEEQDQATETGFVMRANTYGSPEEDAYSRDFTMNALFYDPVADELHDFVGGRGDLERRVLRTIGDAEQRFREDPVRILRAVKFAARLGLDLDVPIRRAAPPVAPRIEDCPVSRVTEELFRLMEKGHARSTFEHLEALDVASTVLPEVVAHLEASPERRTRWLAWLDALDRQVAAHGPLPRESLFTLLTWPLVRDCLDLDAHPGEASWGAEVAEQIRPAAVRMAVPVRHRQLLRASANVLQRLVHPPKRLRRRTILRSPALPVVLTLLRLEFLRGWDCRAIYDQWTAEAEALGIYPAPLEPRVEETALALEAEQRQKHRGHDTRKRSGRRGGRRRRRRHQDGDSEAAPS